LETLNTVQVGKLLPSQQISNEGHLSRRNNDGKRRHLVDLARGPILSERLATGSRYGRPRQPDRVVSHRPRRSRRGRRARLRGPRAIRVPDRNALRRGVRIRDYGLRRRRHVLLPHRIERGGDRGDGGVRRVRGVLHVRGRIESGTAAVSRDSDGGGGALGRVRDEWGV